MYSAGDERSLRDSSAAQASQDIGTEQQQTRTFGSEAMGHGTLEHAASGGDGNPAETYLSSISHPIFGGASRHPRQRGVTWGSVEERKGSGDARPRSGSPLRGGYADGRTGGRVSDGGGGGGCSAAAAGAGQHGDHKIGGGMGAADESCDEGTWQTEPSRAGGRERAEEGSHCSRVRGSRIAKHGIKGEGHRINWEGPQGAMPGRNSIRRMEAVRRGEGGGAYLIGGVKSRRRGYLQGERCRVRRILGARGGLDAELYHCQVFRHEACHQSRRRFLLCNRRVGQSVAGQEYLSFWVSRMPSSYRDHPNLKVRPTEVCLPAMGTLRRGLLTLVGRAAVRRYGAKKKRLQRIQYYPGGRPCCGA